MGLGKEDRPFPAGVTGLGLPGLGLDCSGGEGDLSEKS